MFYPLKFKPVYKNYIWGGRNLEKLGKVLPDGIVAESWEVSCHPDGMSIIANGEFEGMPLDELLKKTGRRMTGSALSEKDITRFPLLVKFIDANDDLSVQVHPDDSYAFINENGEYGKNEMWYIISAKPGAKLLYDVIPGTTKEVFAQALKEDRVESCLKYVEVFPGDVINIPAGIVHAIGRGIVLAEIQQNSNTTYRVYDFNRVDKGGNKRPLHNKKALDVIDFNSRERKEKYKGLEIKVGEGCSKTYLVANNYFSAELYDIDGKFSEEANGSRFFIYTFTEGKGTLDYKNNSIEIKCGESIFIPASLGNYAITGRLKALKSCVPNLEEDVIEPLKCYGYSCNEIYENVGGLTSHQAT